MLEAIGIAIVVMIWVVSSLIKGFKWLLRQTNPAPPPQAPPPSQVPFQAPPPGQTLPRPQVPAQVLRSQPVREMPRQPSAGGPAVPTETNRRDFERQEQELFASEPAALDTLLVSPSPRPAAQASELFSGTDDLVRAIILQEVLGPPLSRRKSIPAQPPQPTAPQ